MAAHRLGFEGGADHTVVVDTQAIATLPLEIVQSEERRVIYEAPLQEEYAACVGTAQSARLSMYDPTDRLTGGRIFPRNRLLSVLARKHSAILVKGGLQDACRLICGKRCCHSQDA
ncbi:MAG: hypothetical protein ACFB8W_09295 [Elainellaceae cyanobacterium]